MKSIVTLSAALCCAVSLQAAVGFEYAGVMVKEESNATHPTYTLVKREIPAICQNVVMSNETVWTGNYARANVPEACKSTYMHTTGKLQPIRLHDEIETYGELEVLAFMKEMQTDDRLMLVDARKESWYDYMTIPGSVNLPFHHFKRREIHLFDFEDALHLLGVKVDAEEEYDFTEAKTVVIYCNGPWCGQSAMMIEVLIEIDYPLEKVKWYRGGMQSWLGAGMTVTKNESL